MSDLAYQWHGGGEPLVLIAGLGGKGTSWHPFLKGAASTQRVLTFDNRGAGKSPPLPGPTTLRELAADVLRLLDHLQIERVPVIGRSMGGMIAQELALLAPSRVSKLVLVCTAGRSDPQLAGTFRLWAEMAERGVPSEIRHRTSMAWCLGREFARDPSRLSRYLKSKGGADRAADYAIQARACAQHDALDRLAELRIPTLVVAGRDDRLTPPCYAEELAKAIPGAQLAYIPAAGHLAYLESPARFASVTLGFLKEQNDDAELRRAG
jgi:pimeloyl-ACP methyl ester carboxylesterase